MGGTYVGRRLTSLDQRFNETTDFFNLLCGFSDSATGDRQGFPVLGLSSVCSVVSMITLTLFPAAAVGTDIWRPVQLGTVL